MMTLLFNDTYHGARWTYGARYRPLHTANVPAGWIIGSDRAHPDYAYGTVDYPRELTPAEVRHYELAAADPEAPAGEGS
jgi:hypothetical protein